MIELPYDSFSAVAHLFTPKKQLIPAIAVIRGNYPGRVFVDHLQRPHVAVVWATGRWMYLLGEVTTTQQKTSIKQFMQDKEYFIDIDTLIVEERRKGYATLAAIRLISYFLEKICCHYGKPQKITLLQRNSPSSLDLNQLILIPYLSLK